MVWERGVEMVTKDNSASVCFNYNLLPTSSVGLVWERMGRGGGGKVVDTPLQFMNMLSTNSSMYSGCGTGCRWFAITTKVTSPSHPYVCGIYLAPPLLRVPIGRVWVEVFLLQAWDDLKWKVIPASRPCWIRQLLLSTFLFNKINKQQFSLSTLERGRQNVENLSETMSRRRMVLLQSSEHFDLIFMVFSWRRFLQNRALDKERNTLRHHRVICLVYTLTDHSSQPVSVWEIAQLLKQIYSRVF